MNKFEIEYDFEVVRCYGDYYDPIERVESVDYTYTLDEEDLIEWLEENTGEDIDSVDLEDMFDKYYTELKKAFKKRAEYCFRD